MDIKYLHEIFLKHPDISTDSRNIKNNGLFFALKGDKFNGNQFADKAIENGAAYAIIDEGEFAIDDRYILVENVLITLQKLANYHRKYLNIPIVAITGSNGKTTSKELISSVLQKKFNMVFTKGNLNNHIGVPLTLLSMTEKTEFGVVEMGANHQLEIKTLCEIAEPNFGIITNIGRAHLEGFGSFENIIKTKCELYDFLNSNNGVVFYNSDNAILKNRADALHIKTIKYGSSNDSFVDGRIIGQAPFIKVEIDINKSKSAIDTNLIGDYNLENILAAFCIGIYFQIDKEKIISAIQSYIPSNNRSQFLKTKTNNIYLDAYNANPSSIKASILNFIRLEIDNKCLILGDMLELGSESEMEHMNVLNLIHDRNFKKIVLVGQIFSKVSKSEQYNSFENVDQAIEWLNNNKISHSNVLIKGSRGIQLERVVEYL